MACGNCNTCDVSEKRGCGTSSVFDWLYQIESVDENNRKLVEVQFQGDRKDFFTNLRTRSFCWRLELLFRLRNPVTTLEKSQ